MDFLGMRLGRLGVRGLPECPLCPPAQAKHSRGSKLREGGSQLGHGEHIGERLGGTLQLSDFTALFASGVAPEELYLATLCRAAPSLSP